MTGVIILSIGGTSYAGWAQNLAASLRFYSPNLQVDVVGDEVTWPHLIKYEKVLFDKIHRIKDEHKTDNGQFSPGKAKLHIDRYSRFEKTIYIDADSIVVKDITPLFDLCKEGIKGHVCSVCDENSVSWPCQWMNLDTVRLVYGLASPYRLPEINSSFLFFDSSQESREYFAIARKCFLSGYKSKWGMSFPDELAFNVSAAKCGIDLSLPQRIIAFKDYELENSPYIISLFGMKRTDSARIYAMYSSISSMSMSKITGKTSNFDHRIMMRKKFIGQNRFITKEHIEQIRNEIAKREV